MRKMLLAATMLLTTSAPAWAWPWPVGGDTRPAQYDRYDRNDTNRPYGSRYYHERYNSRERERWTRDYHGRWTPLASGYSARTDRQFVRLLGRGGGFRYLRIEADRGMPFITKVAIEDVNGNTQVVDINERIPAGEGEVITVNEGSPINRIVVYTDPSAGGAYSVYGG